MAVNLQAEPALSWPMRAATSPEAWREGEPRKAVFVDKDGTLVHDVPYNVDPDRIVLIPGVGESLRRLQDAGFLLFVVSNQPGVALGRFPASALRGVEARLDELVGRHGVVFTGYCWCPHPPVGVRNAVVCTCRKPRPGMLLDAAATHGVTLERSWMVGDILDDIEAGNRAGCRTILVDRGGETRWRAGRVRTPNAIVYQFADAAAMILDGTRDGAKGRPRVAPA
jgi:histidinol-phosphate phosphatase family protein